MTFNLNGSVDLGLVGFDFHLGSIVDVSGIEKSAEKTLDAAATHLDGYCKAVASGVTQVATEADNQITHVAETFVSDAGHAVQDLKNVASTVENTVVHFGEKVIDDTQQEAQAAAQVTERVAQSVAKHVESAAETVANDIKNVAQTVGKVIKNVAETAANKVAGFFKSL